MPFDTLHLDQRATTASATTCASIRPWCRDAGRIKAYAFFSGWRHGCPACKTHSCLC
jgi:hypothetical protein